MSRIGKAPILIPNGVTIDVSKSNMLTVKGPKGEFKQQIDPDLSVGIENGELTVSRPTDQKRHRSIHGLYRSLIDNAIEGVTNGYTKTLHLIGVGYRCSNSGQLLELTLGYSHPVYFVIPPEVKLQTSMEKGKPPTVILESHDKQLIGQVAAKIKAFRKVEPYKGKGVMLVGDYVRRKAGKTAAK